LDPEPIDARRLARDAITALAWALACAVVVFPAFWVGYRLWWRPEQAFLPASPPAVDVVLGQLLGVALPEEAFYRGYLQTELDRGRGRRLRVLGAELGPGVVVSAALFAVGHVLTVLNPARLAVFFPALVFGWLRAKTRGIGAALAFHAMCNLFAEYLAQSYGLFR
jgi:membrane protease YdiL (CAAX protease family)